MKKVKVFTANISGATGKPKKEIRDCRILSKEREKMSQSDSFKKVKRNIRTPDGYKKLSQWTSAQTVELGDGDTLESRYAGWDAAKAHADSAHARTDATKTEASSSNGYLKINGTETRVYTHPSTSGYRHIPAGGHESQILKCSGNGSAAWGDFPSGNVYTGVCATLQGASAKTVECPGFQLYDGARVMVTFTKGSTTNYLTLNVNGTGAYFAWFPLGQTRSFNDKAISKLIAAGCAYEFIFQEGGTEKDSKWVYCGVVSTAESLGAVKKTGDTMTGNIEIYAEPSAYTESQVNVTRGDRGGRLVVSANNKFGLYDTTRSKWVVASDENGSVNLNGHAETASDASRSDGLQSFREDMSCYNRGEYVIRSVFNYMENRFYLKCFNDNADTGRHDMGVDYAISAGSTNASQYLRTFSASGDGHGDAYLLKCQHNLYGDGYFGFAVEGHKIEVDHALAATRDGYGRDIVDTYITKSSAGSIYMPKSGGTFTGYTHFNVDGGSITIGNNEITNDSFQLLLSNYAGDLISIVLQTDTSSGNEAHLSFYPMINNADTRYSDCYLGTSSKKWNGLYAKNGAIITSDKNQKTDIQNLDADLAIKFIKGLIPSSFKMVDGQSGRTHYGLIAQDIEELMSDLGMSSLDFAGFIKSPKTKEIWKDENNLRLDNPIRETIEDEYNYALRYDEFIAPIIAFVQYLDDNDNNLKKKIADLREENGELRQRLEALEKIILKTGVIDRR